MLNKFAPQRKRYGYLRDFTLLSLLAYGILSYQQREMITGEAPTINALNTLGQSISLTQNEPTLIYFWGTWCSVCRITSPMINSLSSDAKVISIAVSSGTDANINQFIDEHDYHFDVINDKTGIAQTWGVLAYPSIYIVDAQGQIRFKTSGATSSWGLRIRMFLASF